MEVFYQRFLFWAQKQILLLKPLPKEAISCSDITIIHSLCWEWVKCKDNVLEEPVVGADGATAVSRVPQMQLLNEVYICCERKAIIYSYNTHELNAWSDAVPMER